MIQKGKKRKKKDLINIKKIYALDLKDYYI